MTNVGPLPVGDLQADGDHHPADPRLGDLLPDTVLLADPVISAPGLGSGLAVNIGTVEAVLEADPYLQVVHGRLLAQYPRKGILPPYPLLKRTPTLAGTVIEPVTSNVTVHCYQNLPPHLSPIIHPPRKLRTLALLGNLLRHRLAIKPRHQPRSSLVRKLRAPLVVTSRPLHLTLARLVSLGLIPLMTLLIATWTYTRALYS